LEWLVSTPAFHHWHHTNDENRDHNFAAIFPFIDRAFGTSWLPKYWPPVYGIDAKVPPTLAGQLLDPLTRGTRLGSGRSEPVPAVGAVQK
jgi:sterol desaturase/sphingolipid hydroxylase (fatty acid hydroxylase superfamily)